MTHNVFVPYNFSKFVLCPYCGVRHDMTVEEYLTMTEYRGVCVEHYAVRLICPKKNIEIHIGKLCDFNEELCKEEYEKMIE